jgi:hypothetical protein
MQIRCTYCHKHFALGKHSIYAALNFLSTSDLSHYNTQCPHCRRANHVSKAELQRAAPDWTLNINDADQSPKP